MKGEYLVMSNCQMLPINLVTNYFMISRFALDYNSYIAFLVEFQHLAMNRLYIFFRLVELIAPGNNSERPHLNRKEKRLKMYRNIPGAWEWLTFQSISFSVSERDSPSSVDEDSSVDLKT